MKRMDRSRALALWIVIGLAFIGAGSWLAARPQLPDTKPIAAVTTAAPQAATSTPEGRKIRVLLVPGHEPEEGGAIYGNLKERDVTVQLAKQLQDDLAADGRFETTLARDENGWSPELSAYFSAQWDAIDAWRKEARAEMRSKYASGELEKPDVAMKHNAASDDAARRLYGITKWADEHGIDVMIHLHFDDEVDSTTRAGKRNGFALFVPPPVYSNAVATRPIAEAIRARLGAFDPIGNADAETATGGIVEDPQLIAVGTADTAAMPSLLIEYAYLYQPELQPRASRDLAFRDMAYQTALGLEDAFFGQAAPARATSVLPYPWKRTIGPESDPADVYALQTALIVDGEYPPSGKSRNQCSRSGQFGPCTLTALDAFQKKYGITGEAGYAGPKTLAKLGAL